jgi:PAS domain S-box-containing protein
LSIELQTQSLMPAARTGARDDRLALLASIVDCSDDAIISKDLDGVVTSWNRAAERIYGYPADEIIGTSFSVLIQRDHPEEMATILERIRAGDRIEHYETIRVRKDGSLISVSLTESPIRDTDGTIIGISSIARDITEHRRVEEQLESSIKYSVYGKDIDHRIVIWNEAAHRNFGYNAQEILGRKSEVLHAAEDIASGAVDKLLDDVQRKGLAESELILVRKDGSHFPAVVVITRRNDASGSPIGFLVMSRDISEKRRAEEALTKAVADLERSNKELEQFAYVASHDLQEPLRMVSSYTQLLGQKYAGQLDDKAKMYIDYAVDGARRMQQLITDLLTFSRVSTRGKPPEATDSNLVLDEVRRNLEPMVEEKHAVVTNDALPTVRTDRSQFAQVLQNLIANGIKFNRSEAPRVHVSAHEESGDWLFAVKDNGIGIDPAFANKLFVIFQRLHTRQEYPGSGIGLAVCKRIVERQGGRIWFESEPGKGSTFFFTVHKQGRRGAS